MLSVILEERNLKVATKVEEWPRTLRRGSINSFGYGGANAHVILESIDSYLGQKNPLTRTIGLPTNAIPTNGAYTNGVQPNNVKLNGVGGKTNGLHSNRVSCTDAIEQELFVLPVSAASPRSLQRLVQQISRTISESHGAQTLQSIAHTLTKGRDHLRHRSFLLASVDGVKTTANEEIIGSTTDPLPFGFVFTGQGAQYAGMGKELLYHSQEFRETIHELDDVLQALTAPYTPSWTLEGTLLDDLETSRINEVTHSQPVCTAVQIGLVNLLRSWGIKPSAVVGHSSGEIAAAFAAGFLTTSQAILVAYFRGYAVGQLRTKGAMMAAGLSFESAQALIESKGLEAQARVACINSPESVTLSGSSDAIETLLGDLQSQNKFARKLQTGGRAYHSHMMEEVGQLYEDLLTPLFHRTPKAECRVNGSDPVTFRTTEDVKMYSSVGHRPDALRVMDSQSIGAAYWRQNLEQPVQFSSALKSLVIDRKKVHMIEVGPHLTLKGPIQQIRKGIGLDQKSLPYSSTLVRNEDSNFCIKTLAGTLFTRGYSLAWDHVNALGISSKHGPHKLKPRIVYEMANYPWDYSSDLNWSEPRASVELRSRKHMRHELLGTAALTGNGIDFTWRNILKPSEMLWIKDHKLEGQVVFPAAGFIAVAIEAVSQVTGIKKQLEERQHDLGFELRNINVITALNIPDEKDSAGKDLELHTTIFLRKISGTSTSTDWHDFSISSLFWTSSQATLHCTGSIRVTRGKREGDSGMKVNNAEGFDLWSSTNRWYTKWDQEGLCFGPQFRSLTSLRTDSVQARHEAIATTRIEPKVVGGPYEFYPVHPITIDAGLQAACLSGTAGRVAALKAWLPVFIAECYIQPPTGTATDIEGEIHVKSEEMGFSSRRIDGVSTCNLIQRNSNLSVRKALAETTGINNMRTRDFTDIDNLDNLESRWNTCGRVQRLTNRSVHRKERPAPGGRC
jgi:acyl transferase domain-containing protein